MAKETQLLYSGQLGVDLAPSKMGLMGVASLKSNMADLIDASCVVIWRMTGVRGIMNPEDWLVTRTSAELSRMTAVVSNGIGSPMVGPGYPGVMKTVV